MKKVLQSRVLKFTLHFPFKIKRIQLWQLKLLRKIKKQKNR